MNYQEFRIDQICDMVRGIYPTMKTEPGSYPLVVTASTFQLEGPAVCVPLISSTGHGDATLHRVHYEEGKFALANLLVALLPKDFNVCFTKDLYHLLMAKKNEYFVPLMLGTANVSLKEQNIASVKVPLPPLAEQRRIVARIEELAAKIEVARRLRRETVEEADMLATSSITRLFDDVSIEGSLRDVLLGKPRNGWSARCDNLEGGVPVLTLSAVTGFQYKEKKFKRTSELISSNAHYWLKKDDLLITRSNTPELVGHAAIYNGNPFSCIYPDLIMNLKIDQNRADVNFVHYWLQSAAARSFIRRSAKGTSPTMKKISQEIVMSVPFPSHLSKEEQRRIVAYLDTVQAKVDAVKALQAETEAELNALLPAVLDRAFKGEL